jgi:hypothetical protein
MTSLLLQYIVPSFFLNTLYALIAYDEDGYPIEEEKWDEEEELDEEEDEDLLELPETDEDEDE